MVIHRLIVELIVCGTLTGAAVAAQAVQANGDRSPSGAEVKAALDAAVDRHAAARQLPGLVVLLARDGELVYRNCVGFADLESSTPVTEASVFRMASVSKLFAAALGLRLEELGQVDLNARVDTLLPEIPGHHTSRLVDLLSCRGGVRHYGEAAAPESPSDWDSRHYTSALEAARQFWHDPLAAPVGQYHYSTHGYTILGAAIEMATGKPVGTLLEEHLAGPCQLATLKIEDRSLDVPERVTLYRLADPADAASGNIEVPPDDISWKILGGGLECSALDLIRFGILLGDGQVISPESLARMATRIDPAESYALGCDQYTEQGLIVFTKSGGQTGVSSYIWCAPEKRLVMVVVTNRQDQGGSPALGDALRRILLASFTAGS
jgi:CubicO group peptidase (beta-lactamase class C family)